MGQLSASEKESLIFQTGISKKRGGNRHFPHAFTQEGIAMEVRVGGHARACAERTVAHGGVRLRRTLTEFPIVNYQLSIVHCRSPFSIVTFPHLFVLPS
jgi:hypothetical protein